MRRQYLCFKVQISPYLIPVLATLMLTVAGGCRRDMGSWKINEAAIAKSIDLDTVKVEVALPDSVIPLDDKLYVNDSLSVVCPTIALGGQTYFVLESDILLTPGEFGSYSYIHNQRRRYNIEDFKSRDQVAITGEVLNGQIVRWDESNVISYCFNKFSFASQEEYELVRTHMTQAVKDWEATCGVKFEYKEEFDDDRLFHGNENVSFVVAKDPFNNRYFALAFFPYDPKSRRTVWAMNPFFHTDLSQAGILRHEIGHILGFRHEQAREDAHPSCKGELVGPGRKLYIMMEYDPKSVMHYLCGDMGSKELLITASDKKGAQLYYGPPL